MKQYKMNAGTWGEQDFLGEGNQWGLAYSGEKEIIKKAGLACGDDKTACVKDYHLLCGNEDTGLASVKCSFWMQMRLWRRKSWKLWCELVSTNQELTVSLGEKDLIQVLRKKVRQVSGYKANKEKES